MFQLLKSSRTADGTIRGIQLVQTLHSIGKKNLVLPEEEMLTTLSLFIDICISHNLIENQT